MGRWLAMPLLLILVCSLAPARGQDFDLSDAFDDVKPTKKTTPAIKKPQPDDSRKPSPPKPNPGQHGDTGNGFSLEDALSPGGNDDSRKPSPPKPNPDHHGGTADISDDDLKGHSHSGGSDDRSDGENAPADSPGVIPGIVSAVVVALAGAVSSFIAYQKKKLCFKGNDEPKI